MLVPAGYSGIIPLTITNTTTATLNGSTSAPPADGSGTDYVVPFALTGAAAATIYGWSADHVAFSDVDIFWTNPSTGAQTKLDMRLDQLTQTGGAWSGTSVRGAFKLQSSIAAGASSSTYGIASGNTTPQPARNWSSIYPFYDSFAGTTLDTTRWSRLGSAVVTINNGLRIAFAATAAAAQGLKSILPSAGWPLGRRAETLATWTGTIPSATGAYAADTFSPVAFLPSGSVTGGAEVRLQKGVVAPFSGNESSYSVGGTLDAIDASPHLYTVSRDPSTATVTASLDGVAATVGSNTLTANAPLQITGFVGSGALGTGYSMTAAWVLVRPWAGSDPTVTPGLPTAVRATTVVPSTTTLMGLAHAGRRSIVRQNTNGTGNWCLVYSDGTALWVQVGATPAALAAATPTRLAASATAGLDMTVLPGPLVVLYDSSGGTPADSWYYNGTTWVQGNHAALPAGATYAGTYYGTAQLWHLAAATPGGSASALALFAASGLGGAWTALSTVTPANSLLLPSGDMSLALAEWGGNKVVAFVTSGGTLQYSVNEALGTLTPGSNQTAVALSTGGTAAIPVLENLALCNSLNNGAGDLWIAYNNSTTPGSGGLVVRLLPAGSATPGQTLSWTAETAMTTNAGSAVDFSPVLVRDGTGAMTLLWLDGGYGTAVMTQALANVGGAITRVGLPTPLTTSAAARSALSCAAYEPAQMAIVWTQTA